MKLSLFVYGTLHPDRAPAELRPIVQGLIWRGSGTVQGVAYDLGDYPALVLTGTGQSVLGDVFELPDDNTLAELDNYEGFDPAWPATSLFVRRICAVTFPSGLAEDHWVYVYNQELPADALPLP